LPEPKYDPFQTVSFTLKERKIATVHKGNYVVATIDLGGLQRGASCRETIRKATGDGEAVTLSNSTRSPPPRPRELASADAELGYPGLAVHLRVCWPCAEDFSGLLAAAGTAGLEAP
jgi:hypothetical protein